MINPNFLQQKASNPKASCWVNASAGSGKTKVLVDRIIRLLLNGVKPERILCLTFSRAAALEMQQRLQKRLKNFSTLSKEQIIEQIVELGEIANAQNISNLVTLIGAIEAQPVAIQTVHSFCQALLQKQFEGDFVKNIPRVMENFEEQTYLRQAFLNLLENSNAISYIEEFLAFHGDQVLFDYLCKSVHSVSNLDFAKVKERLHELLDVDLMPEFPIANSAIHAYVKEFFNVSCADGPVEIDHEFSQIFLTQKGTVRSKILSKDLQSKFPEAEGILKIYGECLSNYFSQKKRFDHLQKSLQFWQLQQFFKDHYKKIKQAHHLWDFVDLIEITLQTLRFDTFDQVLLSLNYRIDHIMLDEAQDTSVMQWQVIEHLVNGLFQASDKRSLFIVGDEKQSIYSFQGADVNVYKQLGYQFKDICNPWEEVFFNINFRSGKNILSLVDDIFSKDFSGLGDTISAHEAWSSYDGSVAILPLVSSNKTAVSEEWPVFENYLIEESNEQLLCTQVIDTLQQKISQGLFLECKKRKASFGDVMVLMRKRGRLMSVFGAICDERAIPYVALDPKNLMKSLVVQDVLSIVEFMLMPLNDMNLAGLLKSPWMQSIDEIDEDALFELCHNRKGHLWHDLQQKYPAHAQLLKDLLQVCPVSAYDYFQIAYDKLGFRDEMLFVFMEEVFKRSEILNLGIRELINNLYDFPPHFVPDISSYSDQGIKVSTVHGSKGLEAPIVVLLDNADEPSIKQDIVLYDPVAKFYFLKPPQSADTVLTAALKNYHQQNAEFEHNRLFYVALTRAQEHLVLAGIEHNPNPSSWYWRVKHSVESCI